MPNSITDIIAREYAVECTFRRGEYHWHPLFALNGRRSFSELHVRIEARIVALEAMQSALASLNAPVSLAIAASTPIAPYVLSWFGRYSQQWLRRQLGRTLETSYWYASNGIREVRKDNRANAIFIELLLAAMDVPSAPEKEMVAA